MRKALLNCKSRAVHEYVCVVLSYPSLLRNQVYASLGEEFVDGEEFDGAVVRGAIKRSILIAMKS